MSSKALLGLDLAKAVKSNVDGSFELMLEDEVVASSVAGATVEMLQESLAQLRDAE